MEGKGKEEVEREEGRGICWLGVAPCGNYQSDVFSHQGNTSQSPGPNNTKSVNKMKPEVGSQRHYYSNDRGVRIRKLSDKCSFLSYYNTQISLHPMGQPVVFKQDFFFFTGILFEPPFKYSGKKTLSSIWKIGEIERDETEIWSELICLTEYSFLRTQ